MALLQVWLPALVVGHVVALVLLVYGAGVGVRSVTRYWRAKHKEAGLPRTTSCSDSSEAGCDQVDLPSPLKYLFHTYHNGRGHRSASQGGPALCIE